ncbi:methyltransferase family protein [Sphingorhabdus arenilitoris]|uniref:Methyltransferase family protein n=1 Tax=Sphingorhabdus arenilitoris TaxID=1490041 RepID=A0ABV8RHU6_9SPHN
MEIAPQSLRQSADPRPVSAVSHRVGLCGIAGLILWVMIARNFGSLAAMLGFPGFPERADGPYSALIAVVFTGLPMALWSLSVDKVHRRASTGLDWSLARPVAQVLDDSIVKLAGLWFTWGMIAAVYMLFRFWWSTQYANFPFSMDMFEAAVIPLVILSVPYVIWIDRYLVNPREGAWHLGAWIAGQDGWNAEDIFHHLRAWAVKGFFLAFMISIVPGGFQEIVNLDPAKVIQNPVWLATALITAMFLVDVQFATVGYLLTMKPLDAHIRTANPYMAGWVAALICYPPFILMTSGGPLDYHVATSDWAFWLSDYPILLWIWGGILVALTAIYAWATVAFGLRFSNLTHRGILTHGPYAWTKHPAYLSKNIYWWLATMPFLVTSGSMSDMVRNSAIMLAVSGIYYWRARTEERHLLADPIYKEYAEWMDRNAAIPRFFQWLKGFAGNRLYGNRAKAQDHSVQPAE